MEISVTGLNHKRAPVELREKLAVTDAALPAALAELQRELGAAEMVILSTCNRVELYMVHEETAPPPERVATALAGRHGVPEKVLFPALYHLRGADAVRHLFRVASSLDSMVLGETQILGQVKDAYLAAKEAAATGRVFNRLFQRTLHVAKRVRSTTSIGERNVSVPSVAARLAERIFQDLTARSLVMLGAGETGELTLGAFRARGVTRFHVVNRTLENARALAERFGGTAHALSDIAQVLSRGDIILSCVSAEGYLLLPAQVESALQERRFEPIFLIDIAVPRNVHPAVNEIQNVYLYDIDDLQAIAQQNLLEREHEVARCEPLMEQEARIFLQEVTPPDIGALLEALRGNFQEIGNDEVQRTLAKLEALDPHHLQEAIRPEVLDLARRILNKILHTPQEQLRRGALDGHTHALAELVRKLFGLKK